jgi:hypothetical protein
MRQRSTQEIDESRLESEDDVVWPLIARMVAAAREANGIEFAAVGGSTTSLGDAPFLRLVAYVDYLLRGRASAIIGHRPSGDELTELAVRLHPEFITVIKPEYVRLVEVLNLAYREMDPEVVAMPPDDYVMQGTAAIGVMLRETGEDIEDRHERIVQWYAKTSPGKA